jgi:hypothetical protein
LKGIKEKETEAKKKDLKAKEANIKKTNIKETNIKETNVKETNVKETNIKEANVKKTDGKQLRTQEAGTNRTTENKIKKNIVEMSHKKENEQEILSKNKRATTNAVDRVRTQYLAQDIATQKEEKEEQKEGIFQKIKEYFSKLLEKLKKVKEKLEYTYEQICDKIDLVSEWKEKITDFIVDEIHIQAYERLKKEGKELYTSVKPAKIKGNLKLGFESPMTTGLVVAGISLVHPHIKDNLDLEADFDSKVLVGDLRVKGKFKIGSLLWFGIKLLVDKAVRVTIKDIMKLVPKDISMLKKA